MTAPTENSRSPAVIVFRYDDFEALPGFMEQIERTILDSFTQLGITTVFSVIPSRLQSNPDKINFLKPYVAAGSVEIALHGWDHLSHSQADSAGMRTEFCGLPYEQQLERIAHGKRLLEEWFSVVVQSFVPPWNSYDLNTLRACATLGMQLISADINGPVPDREYRSTTPILMPALVSLRSLQQISNIGKTSDKAGSLTIVIYHGFEFLESNDARAYYPIADFRRLLERFASRPDVVCKSLSEAARLLEPDLTYERYRIAQQTYRLARRAFSFSTTSRLGHYLRIPADLDTSGYQTESFYREQVVKLQILIVLPFVMVILPIILVIMMLLQGRD